ncbi:CBS domain-containing protein [Streptomyces sp. NBC_01340]|uniref:CBS domain-containing protein n=1 Tax=unclassified Streptomyces TaxID=2593676 RepID=UPI00224E4C6A|nr:MULTISPECIES: CBS domain-containing protein [unclassified Streptomyces]MCX4462062.1 CBS domain-containing protein [Streptomyces sp. NBC_01719]MCX4490970.1 CBS domain-containing protein [Streptomyces sp. NBC_01728]WSI36305.1 CBS domain-containing protein [Streptomyces sp. NBC_01340]
MSGLERGSVERQARKVVPGRGWRPGEENRQDLMLRYLSAVATASAARAGEQPPPPKAPRPVLDEDKSLPITPRVREVMSVPAVSVPGETSFLEIVRTLSREHLGAVPVVDADGRVIGVVSESDLLAKAAAQVAVPHPGPVRRLREHRLYEKGRGETAAALMTSPAITVAPGTKVADAAWLAARSRLKRLPVIDHRDRLVGVVSRIDLVRALVRDDTKIREEIETRIIRQGLLLDPGAFEVTVENGVVSVSGEVDGSLIPKLLESIEEIDDVVEVSEHLTAR